MATYSIEFRIVNENPGESCRNHQRLSYFSSKTSPLGSCAKTSRGAQLSIVATPSQFRACESPLAKICDRFPSTRRGGYLIHSGIRRNPLTVVSFLRGGDHSLSFLAIPGMSVMFSEYDLRVLCTRSLVMEETASMVSKDLRGCAFVVVHDSERTGKRLLCEDFPFGRRPAFLEGSVLDSINDEILNL